MGPSDLDTVALLTGRSMTVGEVLPKWTAKVPAPEATVVDEDGTYRAEIVNYVDKGGEKGVKDIMIRGPVRLRRKEAMKDCSQLPARFSIAFL